MGNPSLIAKLGIDEADLIRGLNASDEGLARSQEKAKLLSAQIALLEQRMAAGKTDAMVQEHTKLQSSLRETQSEAKAAAKQLAALEAIKPPPSPVVPLPDENARYQAHLAKQEEAERSLRARAAMDAARAPMPIASRPMATVRVESAADEASEAGGHGNNAMRNAELMHSGRAMTDAMAAGISPARAFMMEAPRLFQAFASSLSGLLVPIAAVVGGGAFVTWLHEAQVAAKALRAETASIGSNLGSLAGANAQELEKTLAETAEQAAKVQAAFDSKSNWFVNQLTGGGVREEDVRAARAQQERVQDRMQGAQERDGGFKQREFDGDGEAVAADRIRLEYAQKRDEIVRKASADDIEGTTRALEIAQKERDLQLDALARKQAFQQDELGLETQLVSIRRYGKDVAVESARARMEKAKADLDAGPQEGPEHEANLRKYQGAQTDHDDAGHEQKESDASLDLRERNASLRGSSDQVAYAQATNNRDAIQSKLDDPATKSDEAKKLRAELAEAQERLAALSKASDEKGIEIERLGIHAQTERGPQGELDAADKSLALINRQRKENQNKNGDDPLVNAQLNDQAEEMKRKKADILATEKASLETLQKQGDAVRNQGYELDAQEKKKSIEDKYAPEITKAEKEHDSAKVDQIRQNEQGEEFNAEVDEAMMTPQQKADRAKHNLARSQAAERVQSRHQRQAELGVANGGNFGEFFHGEHKKPFVGPKPPVAPNRMPAIQAAAANAGKGDAAHVDNQGIIGAVGKVESAVKELSFKNKG